MPDIKDNSGEGQPAAATSRPDDGAPAAKVTAPGVTAPEQETPAERKPAETTSEVKTPEVKVPGVKVSEVKTSRRDQRSVRGARAASGRSGAARAGRERRRRWPAVVGGVGTLVLAAAIVGAGSVFGGNDATQAVAPVPHALPVGEALANCQGPTQLLAGAAEGTDPEFSANASSTLTQLNAVVLSSAGGQIPGAQLQALDGTFSSLLTIAKAPAESTASAAPTELAGKPKMRAQVVQGQKASAESVLRIQPQEQELSQGSGSVVVAAGDGDLQGLAAATCQTPSNDLWLSGASTTVGRTAVLMMSNSSASPATVSLELYGKDGAVQTAGGKGLVVAAGSVQSVVLAGLAPDQAQLSVHLKSTGGAVSAVIQQSVLRGLTSGGVDYLAPVQAPSSTLVIPGVRVQAPATESKISQQSGYDDAATTLSITVPGANDAVVEVKAFGPDGQAALPDGGVFTATAGSVSEFSLAGLPAGNYSLSLSSDAPVSATARLVNSTKPGDVVDVAYAPSAARLGDTHLVTIPQDVSSELVFTAPDGAASVQLVPITASGVLGQATIVDMKGGMTATVDPSSLGSGTAAVLISASGSPSYGSQLLTQSDTAGIAVLPISGTTSGSQSINIISGY